MLLNHSIREGYNRFSKNSFLQVFYFGNSYSDNRRLNRLKEEKMFNPTFHDVPLFLFSWRWGDSRYALAKPGVDFMKHSRPTFTDKSLQILDTMVFLCRKT
jgi:hypothetical protein